MVRSGLATRAPLAAVAAAFLSLVEARIGWSLCVLRRQALVCRRDDRLTACVLRGQGHVLGREAVRCHVCAIGQNVVALRQQVLAHLCEEIPARCGPRVLEGSHRTGRLLRRRVDRLAAECRSIRRNRDVLLVLGIAFIGGGLYMVREGRNAHNDVRDSIVCRLGLSRCDHRPPFLRAIRRDDSSCSSANNPSSAKACSFAPLKPESAPVAGCAFGCGRCSAEAGGTVKVTG